LSGLMQAVGAAVVCAVLALTIKKESAPLSWGLALAGGIYVIFAAVSSLRAGVAEAQRLIVASGLNSGIYIPVAQVVGIGVLVRISGALCRDAGQSALAAKLELAGTAAAVAASLPLFRQVLDVASSLAP